MDNILKPTQVVLALAYRVSGHVNSYSSRKALFSWGRHSPMPRHKNWRAEDNRVFTPTCLLGQVHLAVNKLPCLTCCPASSRRTWHGGVCCATCARMGTNSFFVLLAFEYLLIWLFLQLNLPSLKQLFSHTPDLMNVYKRLEWFLHCFLLIWCWLKNINKTPNLSHPWNYIAL